MLVKPVVFNHVRWPDVQNQYLINMLSGPVYKSTVLLTCSVARFLNHMFY